MKIEVGKFYKTRDNDKARIYCINAGGAHDIHGAILSPEDGWVNKSWVLNGSYFVDRENSLDIVSEWSEPSELEPQLEDELIRLSKNAHAEGQETLTDLCLLLKDRLSDMGL